MSNKKIKRRTATGPGIPSKEGESPEIRKLRLERQYLSQPFITEGSVFCFSLLDQIKGPSIMVNDYKIADLVVYRKNGVLYGATSGDENHLFFMDKKKMIVDVGIVEAKTINSGSMSIGYDSMLYFAATDADNNTIILKHDLDTDYTDQYPLNYSGDIEETGLVIEKDMVVGAVSNSWDKNIYFLTANGKIYQFDISKKIIHEIFELESGFSKSICADGSGNLFMVLSGGILSRLNVNDRKLAKSTSRVPSQKGREYLAGAEKIVYENGKIYGCTSQDSYLFSYVVESDKVFNFGKPDDNYDIRSFIVEKDGRIYGVTSTKGRGLGHLFLYGENGFRDLGNIAGFMPLTGWCNEPSKMVVGNDGEIFISDGDNRSKLFLYFPKI